jgi:hypothetical protein
MKPKQAGRVPGLAAPSASVKAAGKAGVRA